MKNAEGSCLIQLGDTWVVCTATIEDRVPPFLRGTETGWVTAEYGMLPRSGKERTARDTTGRGAGRTHEIQRLVGRSLRAVVETRALGERTIIIDCDVIQADGGTRTAAITGGYLALVQALALMRERGHFRPSTALGATLRQAQGRISPDRPGVLPILDSVAAVSVGIVQGEQLLDLDFNEDSMASVDMNVVMTGGGRLVEIQGTAEGTPFTRQQMDSLVDLAAKGIKELTALQTQVLEKSPASPVRPDTVGAQGGPEGPPGRGD
jgi:ribonuclease PH